MISQLPVPPLKGTGEDGGYLYNSDGSNYKLMAHAGGYANLCGKVKSTRPEMVFANRDCYAYGYATPDAANW